MFTVLDASYLWYGLEPQPPSSTPHPEIVLARADEILKSLGWFGPRTRIQEHFVDVVRRAQLVEMACEVAERPAFFFPEVSATEIATTKRGKHWAESTNWFWAWRCGR